MRLRLVDAVVALDAYTRVLPLDGTAVTLGRPDTISVVAAREVGRQSVGAAGGAAAKGDIRVSGCALSVAFVPGSSPPCIRVARVGNSVAYIVRAADAVGLSHAGATARAQPPAACALSKGTVELTHGDYILLLPHRYYFIVENCVEDAESCGIDSQATEVADPADLSTVAAARSPTIESTAVAAARPRPLRPKLETEGDAQAWLWVLEQGVQSLEELYALDDEASHLRRPLDELPRAPVFTYEQLTASAGHLLGMFPFLEIAIRPEAEMKVARERLLKGLDPWDGGGAAGGAGAGSLTVTKTVIGAQPAAGRKRSAPDRSRSPPRPSKWDVQRGAQFHSGVGVNLNKHLTEPLKVLHDTVRLVEFDSEDAKRKKDMLENAIGVLSYLHFRVDKVSQIEHVPFISGAETKEKVLEILNTGALQRAEARKVDQSLHQKMRLMEIIWAGPAQVRKWYEDFGLRTVDDIRRADAAYLSGCAGARQVCDARQRIGLEFYEDLQIRVTREEAVAIRELIAGEAEAILPGSSVVVGGSFRRGQPSCGDIDIVVCPPSGAGPNELLPKLYKRLKMRGWLPADLQLSWNEDSTPAQRSRKPSAREAVCSDVARTYFGIWRCRNECSEGSGSAGCAGVGVGAGCAHASQLTEPLSAAQKSALPAAATGIGRRIDIKCFHELDWCLALHAWTGNTILNRCLNRIAGAMNLADLARVLQGLPSTNYRDTFRSEFDLYSYFGLKYIPTKQRCVWGGFEGAGRRAGAATQK